MDTEKLAKQVFGRCPIALWAGNIEAQYCDGIRHLHCCGIIEKTNCDNIQQKFWQGSLQIHLKIVGEEYWFVICIN